MVERTPILSVLLDNERKAKFSEIVQGEGRSMNWVIKDMIDRVIAANSIHIYGDPQLGHRIPVAGGDADNISTEYVSMSVLTEYVDKALSPVNDDLVSIQSQIISRDNWDDLQAQVAQLFSDISDLQGTMVQVLTNIKGGATIKTISHNKSTIGTTSTLGDSPPSREVLTVVNRMIAEPELKTLAETALARGLKGRALIDHLFENGYGANNNSKRFDSSVGSRFQPAIEYMNNGGQANG